MKGKKLIDRRGTPVQLEGLVAQGGEGGIYGIQGHPKFVAKVYHKAPDPDKVSKLEAMCNAATDRLFKMSAWPMELLLTEPGGPVMGCIMPRISGFKDVHLLYGPRTRLREFPKASWPFLVQTAMNLARCVALVHEHGHVIGDVNDKLAMVNDNAVVMLVDTDSFQVDTGSEIFTCDVGVLTHQPPEFQTVGNFRGLHRETNHDNFGLAVLVFQLLFNARHPFSGTFEGEGDLSLEQAIATSRFVYSEHAGRYEMKPPPFSLGLDFVTPQVAALFERAFSPRAEKKGRPEAREWAVALEELVQCARRCYTNPSHAYVYGANCPFCTIERRTGRSLFNMPVMLRDGGGARKESLINVGEVWKQIKLIEAPGKLPDFSPGARQLLTQPKDQREQDLLRQWIDQKKLWDEAARDFATMKGGLQKARQVLEGLDAEYDQLSNQIDHSEFDFSHLDPYCIMAAPIKKLTPAHKAVLMSFGIESAADCTEAKLARVPALRAKVRDELIQWRDGLDTNPPSQPTDQGADNARVRLDREMEIKRASLVQELIEGPAKLKFAAKNVDDKRRGLWPEIEKAARVVEQAAS